MSLDVAPYYFASVSNSLFLFFCKWNQFPQVSFHRHLQQTMFENVQNSSGRVWDTWIYSTTTTTTFSKFTPGKLIGWLPPPLEVWRRQQASSCSRWCSQGRVGGAAAVISFVIQGTICGGNLKDRSGAALLALTNSAACQNGHGTASEHLHSVRCCSALSAAFRMSAGKVPTWQGTQLSSKHCASRLPANHGAHFRKWAIHDVAKAADALLSALTD